MEIPYAIEVRPDTGTYNARLAMWLFLASEAMLFGALFSAYVLLRTGADVWPRGPERLNVTLGSINTVLILAASASLAVARRAFLAQHAGRARAAIGAAAAAACGFLALKLFEYREHVLAGDVPARDNFFATYYVLTGVHALHVVGGILVLVYLLLTRPGPAPSATARYQHRLDVTLMYWYFVDAVWLILFVSIYLR